MCVHNCSKFEKCRGDLTFLGGADARLFCLLDEFRTWLRYGRVRRTGYLRATRIRRENSYAAEGSAPGDRPGAVLPTQSTQALRRGPHLEVGQASSLPSQSTQALRRGPHLSTQNQVRIIQPGWIWAAEGNEIRACWRKWRKALIPQGIPANHFPPNPSKHLAEVAEWISRTSRIEIVRNLSGVPGRRIEC
jgi:hypothetical protein